MLKVIFFGTPQFAADVLDYLIQQHVHIVAVVSKPDRPKGRSGHPVPTPVKSVALEKIPSIPIYQPEVVSQLDFAETLRQHQADLFVVVAYGEIIKQHLLDMPKVACINLHASLLPKYRGAAPIQRCVIEGEKETGVTIMHMVKKMDAGDVIEVARVPIEPEMTFGELEQALCGVGKKVLFKVIQDFEKGEVKRVPQDHSLATLAPKIELEDCEIDWKQSAQAIHDLIRGVNPYPGAWTYIHIRGEKKRLKINRSRVLETPVAEAAGTILSYGKKGWTVATAQGVLELLEVQLEGKKVMQAEELSRGLPIDTISF